MGISKHQSKTQIQTKSWKILKKRANKIGGEERAGKWREQIDTKSVCIMRKERRKEQQYAYRKVNTFEFLQKQEKNTEEWVVNKSAVEI